jgi:hypothetical protein
MKKVASEATVINSKPVLNFTTIHGSEVVRQMEEAK